MLARVQLQQTHIVVARLALGDDALAAHRGEGAVARHSAACQRSAGRRTRRGQHLGEAFGMEKEEESTIFRINQSTF